MKKDQHRINRISKELHKEVANIICFKMQDPRLNVHNVTVSGVNLSKDLSNAKIFISYLIDFDNLAIKNILFILNNSVGFIKNILKKKIKLRIIPNIIFFYDDSMIVGSKISQLLNSKQLSH